MTPIQTAMLQVALSLLVAVTTALLTVWLSLRRFYREKWWEAKMRAYTEVIQALHHMKRDLDINLAAVQSGQDTDTEFHKEWDKKHRVAWDEIRKQTDVGEFLYSTESVQLLERLKEDTRDHDEGYLEHLLQLKSAVEKCLPAIKATARKDLGLPPTRRVG